MSRFASLPIPFWLAGWLIVLLHVFCLHVLPSLGHAQPLLAALAQGLACTAVLWFGLRTSLTRTSLVFLALPYLLFSIGWLNTPAGFVLVALTAWCAWREWQDGPGPAPEPINLATLGGFLLILLWVALSGAGGYGHQTLDYRMHNARLHDLVVYSWPVHYSGGHNLVYYFGYLLPPALLGKWTSLDVALASLYPWLALAVTLAIRWMCVLTGWRFSAALVVVVGLFGPWDLVAVPLLAAVDQRLDFANPFALTNSGDLDFSFNFAAHTFAGNYLSNSFQLFWSPHQVVSGWIITGWLGWLVREQRVARRGLFLFALLCLWAPFPMIALSPLAVVVTWQEYRQRRLAFVTIENTLGAGTLLLVFLLFYLSGSSTANPSGWLLNRLQQPGDTIRLLVFYLCGWGFLLLALSAAVYGRLYPLQQSQRIHWSIPAGLVLGLLGLPLYTFGEYSDLLCRGSSALAYLLLAGTLWAIAEARRLKRPLLAVTLLLMMLPGWGSAMAHLKIALAGYGQAKPVGSVIDQPNAYPNLGPDHTVFKHWLGKRVAPH